MTLRYVNICVDINEDGRHMLHDVTEQEVLVVVEQLIEANLRCPGRVPSLYNSAVRYQSEAAREGYMTADECVRVGRADAVELVAWRCAEIRQSGEDPGAKPILIRRDQRDGFGYSFYVIKVQRSGWTVEDLIDKIRVLDGEQ